MTERVFAMPDLGEGLEEGEVVVWLVAEGDEVELNQPLVEVQTAKATVEIPSPFSGRVMQLHAGAGASVPVGEPLLTFDVFEQRTSQAAAGERHPARDPIAATPPVRRAARDLGIDLRTVTATGAAGRITKEDVHAAARGSRIEGGTVAVEAAPYDTQPIPPMRRIIADRLTRLVRNVPMVTTWRTLDATALEAVRGELAVSPLPVFVKALADVCAHHPFLNATFVDRANEIRIYRRVDVGLGVDTDAGLRTVVLRDAGGKGASALSQEIHALASAARKGSLRAEDAVGSTITVSNVGSYGGEAGTPLINAEEGVIVALGAIGPRALVVDGAVLARPACTLSLTFDHRLLDGATVGRALTDLVNLLQDASRLRDSAG